MRGPGTQITYMSDLGLPVPEEKWPGWIRNMAWAFHLHEHLPSKAAVLRCRWCDEAIRFPTFPEDADKFNGLLWMMTHNYRHVVTGDIDPDEMVDLAPGAAF